MGEIMHAIMTGGPVETAFLVHSDFENYVSGIYHHVKGEMAGGHAVKIVGWGVESGVKYWKVANSWNPYWGEKGYFRIREGDGGIDDDVTGAIHSAKWSRGGDGPAPSPPSPSPPAPAPTPPAPSPSPSGCKDKESFCTMSRNQHIPQYCGSCWAHGAISALGDRVKIARNAKGIDINPSVQHLLNCGTAGSCNGGDESSAYQW